jgi:hypothetical protein
VEDPAGPAATLELRYAGSWASRGNTSAKLRLSLTNSGDTQPVWQESLSPVLEGRQRWSAEPDEAQAAALGVIDTAINEVAVPVDVLG